MKHANDNLPLALAGILVLSTVTLRVSHANDSPTATASQIPPRTFATPRDAINALRAATTVGNQMGLVELFGSDFYYLVTENPVQDAENAERFGAEMEQSCLQITNQDKSITLEVGVNKCPLPIPLVKVHGGWSFDTAAGKDEIINGRISKDEQDAIAVCRAYVQAQKLHAAADVQGRYAQKFASTEGTQDGLFWRATPGQAPSPFDFQLAASQIGLENVNAAGQPQPYHGYFFKILTRQGPDAPGGEVDYLLHSQLTGGFALVACPEHWGRSGTRTFIVGQAGSVYKKDLGPDSRQIVWQMQAYNPDGSGMLAEEPGIKNVAEP